jgi:hypothetical protein
MYKSKVYTTNLYEEKLKNKLTFKQNKNTTKNMKKESTF